jgi:hypothetical protein
MTMSTTTPTLVGILEIADMLNVTAKTVYTWRDRTRHDRGSLPAPDLVISGKPVWQRDRILWWAGCTGRFEDDGEPGVSLRREWLAKWGEHERLLLDHKMGGGRLLRSAPPMPQP